VELIVLPHIPKAQAKNFGVLLLKGRRGKTRKGPQTGRRKCKGKGENGKEMGK